MNFLENITFRRKRSSTSNQNESESTSQILDATVNSLPDLTDDEETDLVKGLREEIDNLTIQLSSAHLEIETLSLENNDLKNNIKELSKKNEFYKNVAQSPAKKMSTPKKSKTPSKTHNLKSVISNKTFEDKIVQTEQVETVQQSKKSPQKKSKRKLNTQNKKIVDNSEIKFSKIPTHVTERKVAQQNSSKVVLISSNAHNKVLQVAEDTMNGSNGTTLVRHYLTPNGGIKQLLQGIDSKVKSLTKTDYCVILIGEEDFKQSCDYINLTNYIRDTLSKIKHTNFIISLPTYKYSFEPTVINYLNMYNYKIDTFGKLLYVDNLAHKYAHIFDSNSYIPANKEMYNLRSGMMKNAGLRTILNNICHMITDTSLQLDTDCSVENSNYIKPNDMQFFRK